MSAPDTRHLADEARRLGRMGIDTEFMPEGRYRPQLCLVQIVVGEHIELLDPLSPEGFDHGPIAEVLADPAVEIILHAGRQDVAILRREWDTEITNLFDTQLAAGFAGFSAQAGYLNLLSEALGISVAKTASFTRWEQRPLTEEQLHYAAEDVEHLLALTDELQRRLREQGRLGWAREECEFVAASTDVRDPDTVWQRLGRVSSLAPKDRAVAQALAAWRERTAERENRPVGSVLKDPVIVELAKRAPTSQEALMQIRGVNPDLGRRRGKEVLEVIAAGRAAEPIPREEGERLGSDGADAPTIALAEALVRSRALQAGLAYELIAARSDLTPIVVRARRGQPEPDVRTLQGWRRELVGEELLALLAGERSLRVDERGRVAIDPVPAVVHPTVVAEAAADGEPVL